jgi:hypothetical protein
MSQNVNLGTVFASLVAADVDSVGQSTLPDDQPTNYTQKPLAKLVGTDATKQAGEFVLNGMELATKEGFGHVAKIWYKKTMSYEDGLNLIEKGKAETEDITATVTEMVPTVENGKFGFTHKPSGRFFVPTEHAVTQAANWADVGTWFAQSLLKNPQDNKERELYKRDAGDAAILAAILRNGVRDGRIDATKKFIWRTRKDNTLRAMLTERYAVVDNRWLIEQFRKLVPGGRLSHWRGDSDTIYGNILIPDTIREEDDSDYGGMLSAGNSEIGIRRVSSVPSIFRAICMNGCIWGQTKGQGIRQVHRGEIDLEKLALEIKENLNKQIPLLPQGIDRMLKVRTYAWDGCSVKPVIAQVAKDWKFSKKQATGVLNAYQEERTLTPELAKTLFGVTNAVTRAGQKFSNADWIHFDEVGGELLNLSEDDFSGIISRAKHLKEKDVDEMFAAVAN